jgi:hypothetical protein
MISIEIVNELVEKTSISELLKRSFVYKSAGKMPALISKNVEHKIEIEKKRTRVILFDPLSQII